MGTADDRRPLLVSVDFEDWHQLVRRRVGAPNWREAGPALGRQTRALLDLLRQLDVRATFFVLGLAARSHPELLEEVVAAGHEIACHGDMHLPVHSQSRAEFAEDLRSAIGTIEQATGRRPLGYRAPAFSIDDRCPWAHEVLAAEGFGYDASEHDTPRLRGRKAGGAPRRLELPEVELWEFPVAVWHIGGRRIPVGGPSYWGILPTGAVLRGLSTVEPLAGLYVHPYEFDPQPLDPLLPSGSPGGRRLHGALRALQRNAARRRAPGVLRAIAESHRLIPYGEAYAELRGGAPAGT